MDQIKIGKFIAACRKERGMTQMQLAEQLHITDRAVSKWETGRAMPDTSVMPELCRVLGIRINDLFHGEVVTMEDYKQQTEQLLLDMAKQKEAADRQLLSLEMLIGTFSVIILLGFSMVAAFVPMQGWLQAVLIVIGFVLGLIGIFFALRIEQTAGYYECAKCGHRYVPTYRSVLWAMHINRTRYMRCPKCNKASWQKKRITKE